MSKRTDSDLLDNLAVVTRFINFLESERITIDYNGHNRRGALTRKNHIEAMDILDISGTCFVDNINQVLHSIESGVQLPKFIIVGASKECAICAKELTWECDGETVRPNEACSYPDGCRYEFDLNVPSGKIVVADDLRQWFNTLGEFNINTSVGKMRQTLAMAEIGCAHGFVGNSCPGIFKIDHKFIIASGNWEDEETYHEPMGEMVGSIVTDLWWFSIVDYDEFKRRSGVEPSEQKYSVIDIKPGVYRFKYLFDQQKRTLHKIDIFAEFEWIRDPDPIRDFKSEYYSSNFTIGQVIHASMRHYPDLYPAGDNGIIGKIDHIFCMIGGGGNWHRNGFVQYDPDMTEEELEVNIPDLDKPLKWYPLSEYSALCCASGLNGEVLFLNDSFLAVAWQVARSIYIHGSNSYRTEKTDEEYKTNEQERKQIAIKCLRGLAKLYPDNIPQNCEELVDRRL